MNANALTTDVKDSSLVVDDDKKEVKKDIKADLAKIDNPNKDVSIMLSGIPCFAWRAFDPPPLLFITSWFRLENLKYFDF